MIELLTFIAVLSVIVALIWGRRMMPAVGSIPSWGTKVAKVVAIIAIALMLWLLVPWSSTPPGKLIVSLLSKDAQEMLVWLLGAGTMIVVSGLIWIVFDDTSLGKVKTILSWLLLGSVTLMTLVGLKGYLEFDQSPEHNTIVDLVKNRVVEKKANATDMFTIRLPVADPRLHSNQYFWWCFKTTSPDELVKPPIAMDVVRGKGTGGQLVKISPSDQLRLNQTDEKQATIVFWRELALKPTCTDPPVEEI